MQKKLSEKGAQDKLADDARSYDISNRSESNLDYSDYQESNTDTNRTVSTN